jgi:hypothetical protein
MTLLYLRWCGYGDACSISLADRRRRFRPQQYITRIGVSYQWTLARKRVDLTWRAQVRRCRESLMTRDADAFRGFLPRLGADGPGASACSSR